MSLQQVVHLEGDHLKGGVPRNSAQQAQRAAWRGGLGLKQGEASRAGVPAEPAASCAIPARRPVGGGLWVLGQHGRAVGWAPEAGGSDQREQGQR